MNTSQAQHYVPQFLLKGFTRGKKKQLFVFDKRTGEEFRTRPHNVAAESGFTISMFLAVSSLLKQHWAVLKLWVL